MSLLLRMIRRARWLDDEGRQLTEHDIQDIQVPPLQDLEPGDNTLSVWHIESDRSNFEQIAAALAAKRNQVSNFDYALVDEDILSEIGITIELSHGDSLNEEANTNWHRDLVNLSDSKRIELVKVILTHGEIDRISHKDVIRWIVQEVLSGRIDRTKLEPGILKKIDTQINPS